MSISRNYVIPGSSNLAPVVLWHKQIIHIAVIIINVTVEAIKYFSPNMKRPSWDWKPRLIFITTYNRDITRRELFQMVFVIRATI